MSLQNSINEHIKQAMIDKEKDKLAALRAVKSAFIIEMTKDGSDVIDDVVAEKSRLPLETSCRFRSSSDVLE